MTPELMQPLIESGDPVECEAPKGFDLDTGLAKVTPLLPALKEVSGRDFAFDGRIEDASALDEP